MKDWNGRERHDTMTGGGTHEFQKRDGYIIYQENLFYY